MVFSESIQLPGTQEDYSPLVSIIVNCYNGDKYLREAIDSVLSQTYQNWELIFWDNQSDDNSKKIFKEYRDDRFRYFYAWEHTRLYEARNYAFQKSKGQFIAFLDVDDWWEPTKLATQMSLFADSEVGLVYSNHWIVNAVGEKTRVAYKIALLSGYVLNQQLKSYTIGMLTIIVRRSSLEDLEYVFDSRYQIIGDFDLVIRLATKCKFASIQVPLAYYRVHANSLSKRHRQLQNLEVEQWLEQTKRDRGISDNDGYQYRKKLLRYSQGLEALEKKQFFVALKVFRDIPFRLKMQLLVLGVTPKIILKLFGQS